MKLLVGLGNPGGSYARNRHNVGFLAVEAIAEAHGFSPWRSKFRGLVAEGRLADDKVLLLKPETFMNLSGDSVRSAMDFFKLSPSDVSVFHDELDLPPGRVRFKMGGGNAGHNGLRSIGACIGPDFGRVRIGIGHPGDKRVVSNYVLGDFAKADHDWLDPLLRGMAKGAPLLVQGNSGGFLSAVTAAAPPPRKVARSEAVAVAAPETEPEETRSPLQRLVDRFR